MTLTDGRPSFSQIFMQFALLLSRRSTCSRAQVGCVITTSDHTRVLSVGYNGGAKGQGNECLSTEPGKCGHLHSEINAIIKLDYNDPFLRRLYTTVEPCYSCATAIINANVREVVYLREYRDHAGLELLERAGIKIIKFATEDLLIPEAPENAQEDNTP